MLLKLLQLSIRNILRHRRRNGVMLAAIVVAVAAVVLMSSLIRGMQEDLAETAVASFVGPCQGAGARLSGRPRHSTELCLG